MGYLYKYQPLTVQTLENLATHQLWLSPNSAFNDPFDCVIGGVAWGTPGSTDSQNKVTEAFALATEFARDRSAFEAYYLTDSGPNEKFTEDLSGTEGQSRMEVQEAISNLGISCLSRAPRDFLMWSHYGNGHRGLCLVFDDAAEPFVRARKVNYVSRVRPLGALTKLQHVDRERVWGQVVLDKASWWTSEDEWRIVEPGANRPLKYHPSALKKLYLGAKMPESKVAVIMRMIRKIEEGVYRLRLGDDFSYPVPAYPVYAAQYDDSALPQG